MIATQTPLSRSPTALFVFGLGSLLAREFHYWSGPRQWLKICQPPATTPNRKFNSPSFPSERCRRRVQATPGRMLMTSIRLHNQSGARNGSGMSQSTSSKYSLSRHSKTMFTNGPTKYPMIEARLI